MDAKSMSASMAYVDALKRSAGGGIAGGDSISSATGGGGNFADMLKDAVGDVVEVTKQSEIMSVRAAAKEVELVDVVAAITNAEVALESVVAVRDKVVQAYQDILRMPI
jgi:flagellar hook-basal body complex protein FliE